MLQKNILGNKIVCSTDSHKKQNQQIMALCVSGNCNLKRTLCASCLEEHPKNHQIVHLQHLTIQLEEQCSYLAIQRRQQQQKLQQIQDECFQFITKKIDNMMITANQAKALSEQKIDLEQKQHFNQNYSNEEDLEKLAIDLQNKINDDPYQPQLLKLLNYKNILFGYERVVRQLVFDTSIFVEKNDIALDYGFFIDDQLMGLANLQNHISEMRQQLIVGFQDEQQNLQYLQSIYEKEDQKFSLYLSQKPLNQKEQISDEQLQYISNLMRLPIGQILQNYPIEQITNQQFVVTLEQPFSSVLTQDYLKVLQATIKPQTLLCFGAIKVSDPTKFVLCAIDYASEIFQPTSKHKVARKSKNGSIYWYYKYGLLCGVIGFSPTLQIDLGHSLNIHNDTCTLEGHLRLSIQIDFKSDCRVGENTKLYDSNEFRWAFYMKK